MGQGEARAVATRRLRRLRDRLPKDRPVAFVRLDDHPDGDRTAVLSSADGGQTWPAYAYWPVSTEPPEVYELVENEKGELIGVLVEPDDT